MKRLSFGRILKWCGIVFLLFFVFLTQMFYSNGLYKSAIWLDGLYRKHTQSAPASVTSLMTPNIIEKNKALIKQSIANDAIFIEGGEFTMGPDNCDNYAPTLSQCANVPVYRVKLSNYGYLHSRVGTHPF